ITMLGGRSIAPLGQAVGLLMQFQNARMSLQTLDKLMEQPVERPDASAFIHRPEITGEIEFRNVSFSYPGQGEAALQNVSLRITPGEHVVVLGRTGSGKTTLQKLMLGLYQPTDGVVRIDGIDLRQLDPADLRRNVGFVGQEAMLFYGTLRENIAIGAPYADDSAIVHAAEVAGLTQFVNRHPKGFDMLIGERGESLSGGQRQEVAIARAVLMDPPVLLFDEPTSAMDFSTEAGFKERLTRFAAQKTVVIVTHRTSLIDLATRIIVVDDGRIVADGPRDKVVEALQSGRIGKAAP
ncbi:MAG: ATP-binding cassette domain-containing protein, partial [Propionivibrio sp.]